DGSERPLYKISTETDLNTFGTTGQTGLPDYDPANPTSLPQFVPQNANLSTVYTAAGGAISGSKFAFPPHALAPNQQPKATATPGGESPSTYSENPGTYSPAPDPQCAGAQYKVNVTDGAFLAAGGSPFEGLTRNLCDVKLFHLAAGQSIAPNF